MIEIKKTIDIDQQKNSLFENLPFDITDSLIFDIETTGFSASTSQLYLIGVTYYSDNKWTLIQWLAESNSDELLILNNFFELANSFTILVHFNGDNFDVPYIQKKCAKLELDHSFDALTSFDLYKYFRKFKNYLPLEKFGLKSIEKHLGITRRDIYTGGELIQNYIQFSYDGNQEDYDKLLLHNEDDLIGTIQLLPASLLGVILSPTKLVVTSTCIDSNYINIKIKTHLPLPCSINYNDSLIILQGDTNSNDITVQIKLFKGILKHFFDNHKDYYYLPLEDQAIHKSVAQFVDNKHKQKSKKSNCYIKLDSIYLPQHSKLNSPYFSQEFNDKITYFELKEDFIHDKSNILIYLTQLIPAMGTF